MTVAEFAKTMSPDGADVEERGWHAVRATLTVPALLRRERHVVGDTLVYEDVFATGRCSCLLGDCIAMADHGQAATEPVRQLITGILADLRTCQERTGRRATLADCVPALYAQRLKPGGRLDRWYPQNTTLHVGLFDLKPDELARYTLVINRQTHRVDLEQIIDDVRRVLTPSSQWGTAITQGDPTEPNVAYPKTWLDFEHAGRNTLAGEAANLLWYLLALGGWLVPRYQPAVYQRTLRYALPPLAVPAVDRLEVHDRHRHIDVDYRWEIGRGRAAAIAATLDGLSDLLDAEPHHDGTGLLAVLRPFLIMRILGVIRLGRLAGTDALLCLARLAQLDNRLLTMADFLADVSIPAAIA